MNPYRRLHAHWEASYARYGYGLTGAGEPFDRRLRLRVASSTAVMVERAVARTRFGTSFLIREALLRGFDAAESVGPRPVLLQSLVTRSLWAAATRSALVLGVPRGLFVRHALALGWSVVCNEIVLLLEPLAKLLGSRLGSVLRFSGVNTHCSGFRLRVLVLKDRRQARRRKTRGSMCFPPSVGTPMGD